MSSPNHDARAAELLAAARPMPLAIESSEPRDSDNAPTARQTSPVPDRAPTSRAPVMSREGVVPGSRNSEAAE